jgi:hypothetical protein
MLRGPQSRSESCEEEDVFFLLAGIEPQSHSYAALIPITINS